MTWRKLRLDARYTDRQSSIFSYKSVTLSEGYNLLTTLKHSAGLDFHQQWTSFSSSGGTGSTRDMTYYSFTGHYEWHPFAGFNWRNETGYELQRGAGSDRDYIVARSYLSWLVGKLDFRLGYEFENQKYIAETRDRHFVFLRMRRNF